MGLYPRLHRLRRRHGKYLDVSHQSFPVWRGIVPDPVFIFVALIGFTGVIGEMSFGRGTRSGPIDAFGMACETKCRRRLGETLGWIPVIGALAMAIGYTVVMGWIFRYMLGTFTGSTLAPADIESFGAKFGGMASAWGNNLWQLAALVICMFILMYGVGSGIEKANKVMMPIFFILFVILGIYVAFQPGAAAGYRYIFRVEPEVLAKPSTWIFALGQAFFSLSVAGNGTLIYGSYLPDSEDIPASAARVALFDTLAAMLAALVSFRPWLPQVPSLTRAVPDFCSSTCRT